MFLFSKYFLFIAAGLILCFLPVSLKLIRKRRYGAATFVVMLTLFASLGIAYILLNKLWYQYFDY